jgi:predicted DNA-binding transcriptional regulator YafY
MRIDRMLSIVVLLLNRKSITARELSERFEVSLRTIYRDIEAINIAGIPVISTQGSGGGYGIMENYKLNNQYLSMDNTRAILTALKGVNTTLRDQELTLAMEKIRSLVPKDQAKELDLRLDQFIVDYLPWGYSEQQQFFMQEINRAIVTSHLLKIRYRNLKGEEGERVIEPMTLMFKGYNWYFFGFCLLKEDGRMFRLSRVRNLEVLSQTFQRREISFKDFTKQDESKGPQVDLVFKFDPLVQTRVEEFFHPEQITVDDQGDLIVKASFPEDNWVYSLILSYGEHIEVLQPDHIRHLIRKKIEKILKKY